MSQDNDEAIVVGAVGSGVPWFLSGWAEGTELEFMIDTGCQVTILATSVFERMCASDPGSGLGLRPCGRHLILEDSSPSMVRGELEMTVVFPGLSCDMLLVVANIGAEGLLGMVMSSSSARPSDRTVVGRWSVNASAPITNSCVLPPDSEIVALVSIRSSSGVQPGRCSLIEPKIALKEDYDVLVGRTLVDASQWSASVLLVNPSSEVMVLPYFLCVGELVLVSAVSVARSAVTF